MSASMVGFMVLLFFYACQPDVHLPAGCPVSPGGDTLVLSANQPRVIFASCDTALTLVATQINDSRCPEGGVCVWSGRVEVSLLLNNQFAIQLEKAKTIDTIYRNHRYSITLTDVVPYRIINQNPQPVQQAVLSITRI